MQHHTTFKNTWTFEAFGADGQPKWSEVVDNSIVDEGINDILDKFWKGTGYTASFSVGLTGSAPVVASADTMGVHAGWTEVAAYDEPVRPALVFGAVSGGAIDNSESKASATVNADATTVGGGFIATDNTKGGVSGTLVAVAAFAGGDKTLDDGDVLNITLTASAASA